MRRLFTWLFFVCLTALICAGGAAALGSEGLLDASGMTRIDLEGLSVQLGKPIQVCAYPAWQEGPQGRWAFNHPVPAMAHFPAESSWLPTRWLRTITTIPETSAGCNFPPTEERLGERAMISSRSISR